VCGDIWRRTKPQEPIDIKKDSEKGKKRDKAYREEGQKNQKREREKKKKKTKVSTPPWEKKIVFSWGGRKAKR
jgi:hypothetical protein